MFKDFGRRLQQDLKLLVDRRIQSSETMSGALMKVGIVRLRIARVSEIPITPNIAVEWS